MKEVNLHLEEILMEDEDVLESVPISGGYLLLTNQRILIFKGDGYVDIEPLHIHAIELRRELKGLVISIVLALIGVALRLAEPVITTLIYSSGLLNYIPQLIKALNYLPIMSMIMVGLALVMLLLWNYSKYVLTIYYGTGSVSMRGNEELIKLGKSIRDYLVGVKYKEIM
jgi:hypothetical protein